MDTHERLKDDHGKKRGLYGGFAGASGASAGRNVELIEAADQIEELETDMSSSRWIARFTRLRQQREPHLDEAQAEVSAMARKAIAECRARQSGDAFSRRKKQHAKAA